MCTSWRRSSIFVFSISILSQLDRPKASISYSREEMSGEQERFLEEYFLRKLYPIVTPLAIDPGHPFPYLANRSLCSSGVACGRLIVSRSAPYRSFDRPYSDPSGAALSFLCPAREGQHTFMLLEDTLRHYLPRLYHGFEIRSCDAIRVTRDADFLVSRRRDRRPHDDHRERRS